MRLRVRQVELYRTACRARLPFRFGAATMTEAPLLTLRLVAETADGRRAEGASSDLLVPKWFDKDPETSVEEDRAALVASALRAGEELAAAGTDTPFGLWRAAAAARAAADGATPSARLVAGFGLALGERALIDAACRAAGAGFFDALRADLLGFDAGAVFPELAGWTPAGDLPPRPASSVRVRHTVGQLDPLRTADVEPTERVDDGLPQALEEDVRAYGLERFKVKIGAGRDADRERLYAVAAALDACEVEGRLTLDANEQYADTDALAGLLADLGDCPRGRAILRRTAFVEQPLPRAASLDPEAARGLAALPLPAVLDEADADLESFPRALELGWRGVAFKACKGVFRGLLARARCDRTPGAFQTAEDLTNLPVVALQQDLCVVAALGCDDVERNGHHYFAGLAHLPPAEAREALERHPDLYADDGAGPRLAIRGGRLALGSLGCTGFGYDVGVRFEDRERIA